MNLELDKYLITKNSSIREALKLIDNNGAKCLIVSDKNKKMQGTLSDGDVRKAILGGKKLGHKIATLFNKKPKFLYDYEYDENKIKNIFLKYLVDLIPIINKKKNITQVIRMDEVFNKQNANSSCKSTSVVIMAGGKGSRLQPFTSVLPKPLIPIKGKPIVDLIIEKFNNYGVMNFFLSLNYKSSILKAFFKERKKNKINFIEEKKPLGTIGALNKMKKKINKTFFVTNCDILIDTDYGDLLNYHKKNKNSVTIVASFRDYEIPYGDCKIDKKGQLVNLNEKPKINFLANTGMYLMDRDIIDFIPKNTKFDVTDLIQKLKKNKKRVGVFPVSENSWLDVGQWNEYRKTINSLNIDNLL